MNLLHTHNFLTSYAGHLENLDLQKVLLYNPLEWGGGGFAGGWEPGGDPVPILPIT